MLPVSVQYLAVSPDGGKVFVTGSSEGAGTANDFATVAYDATTGTQLWAARYNGPANGDDFAGAVAVSPDGSTVYVAGGSTGADTGLDATVVAYSASDGKQLWVARYNGPSNMNDGVSSLAVSRDGTRIVATGTSEDASPPGGDPQKAYLTIGYNAATGAQMWAARYHGPANRDSAYSVALSPNGSTAYVTGWSQNAANSMAKDYVTVAYNASTGAQTWLARYSGSGNDNEGRAVAVSPDGTKVFVTGSSMSADTAYATVAYNAANGKQLWATTRSASPPAAPTTYISSLAVSHDGKTLFAAGIGGTVAYTAATGAQLWSNIDAAASVAVSTDGAKVFVADTTGNGSTPGDYKTIAYNASKGTQLWTTTYNGPAGGADTPASVAVNPHTDTVYVTGSSDGTGTDYATIAYQT